MSETLTLKQRFNPKRFLRGYRTESDHINLSRDRIFILPTRQGISFAIVLFVLLLGALNYNNNMMFAFVFWLASMGFVTMHHTFLTLYKLEITLAGIEHNFAGKPVRINLRIHNPVSRERVGLSFSVKGHADTRISLASNRVETLSIALDTTQRGWYELPRIVISSVYPFGLFRAWAYLNFDRHYAVYPAPLGQADLPEHFSGSHQGKQALKGDDDFSGLKPYQPGDPLKRVHWKRAARSQQWVTKQFETMGAGECMLDWYASTLPTEQKLSQFSLWIDKAYQQGIPFSMQFPGMTFEKDHSAQHRERCLIALARYGHE